MRRCQLLGTAGASTLTMTPHKVVQYVMVATRDLLSMSSLRGATRTIWRASIGYPEQRASEAWRGCDRGPLGRLGPARGAIFIATPLRRRGGMQHASRFLRPLHDASRSQSSAPAGILKRVSLPSRRYETASGPGRTCALSHSPREGRLREGLPRPRLSSSPHTRTQ